MAPEIGRACNRPFSFKDYSIMSGISSVGSYNPDFYYQQLEQALSQQDAQTADSNAAAVAQTAATAATDTTSTSDTKSLQDQIKVAIMAAVQEAENSGGGTDLLTIIQNAVKKALKDAGIDPTTASENDKVDPATKNLLTVLDNQAKVEAQTMNILASLDSQTSADSSSGNLFSQLDNPASNSQSSPDLLGYLIDTQQ
jgi:hypothetical protein